MVKYRIFLYVIYLLVLTSCEIIKKRFLADNTKVPYNNKIFKRGNRNLPKEIDINYIYDLVTAYRCNIDFKRVNNEGFLGRYYIQFYNNGAVRFMNYLEPNPEKSGSRGVFYIRNKEMFLDRIGGSSDGSLVTYSYRLKIEGDYIYLREFQKFLFFLIYQNVIILFIKKGQKFLKNGKNMKQIGNYRIGIDSDRYVRYPIQNIFAHLWLSLQPGFEVLSTNIRPYFQYHTKNKS